MWGTVQFGGFAPGTGPGTSRGNPRVHFRSLRTGRARGDRTRVFLGSLGSMLPLVLMFVVLYFVMIRPQMKRQKEHKAMIEALAKGDEVVIGGGMLGRVSKLGDELPARRGRQRRRGAGAARRGGAGAAQGHVQVVDPQLASAGCASRPSAARAEGTMNRYPWWKYAILAIALLVGLRLHAAQLLRRGAGGAGQSAARRRVKVDASMAGARRAGAAGRGHQARLRAVRRQLGAGALRRHRHASSRPRTRSARRSTPTRPTRATSSR